MILSSIFGSSRKRRARTGKLTTTTTTTTFGIAGACAIAVGGVVARLALRSLPYHADRFLFFLFLLELEQQWRQEEEGEEDKYLHPYVASAEL